MAIMPIEPEEFWDDLLAFIEQKRVIPVVGPELLTVQDGSGRAPLDRAVADRVLKRYGIDGLPLERYGLYEAVSALAPTRRVRDLYRPVNDILQKLLAEQKEIPQPLRDLASIPQ